MEKGQIFSRQTQSIVFGMQVKAVQRMLDFDFTCGRELPSVVAMINPGRESFHKAFFGDQELLIPVLPSIAAATKKFPKADVLINFASFRSAYASSLEAINTKSIKTVVIIAEGVPERKALILEQEARKKGKVVIGPATVGGIAAGAFKIGNTGGTIDGIIDAKLHRPGSVGFVSKSGGLSNEMYKVISMFADGVYEGIAIGGDRYPGTTLAYHVERFEKNPAIKMIVVLGEVGGRDEYQIAELIKSKKVKKPVVIWVTGTCAKLFPGEVQFGHAGAKAGADDETADAKNAVLKKAGAIVPNSFDDFGEKIGTVFKKLKVSKAKEADFQIPAADFVALKKEKKVRKATNFICTISDDRGEEANYNGLPISKATEKLTGIGEVISLLWFKKKLPQFALDYIEMILRAVADHGPAVSGAHNAIVAARAGKDLVSSLCSGLLTVGPRFGGAIDGAAHYFKDAFDRGLAPLDFVKEMKANNINIPGIGHRIKSVKNPDTRVKALQKYVDKHFKKKELINYAREVEKLTTSKKDNLILNVDGFVAVSFLDLMSNCREFSAKDIKEAAGIGYLNGLFVLGRSIGIMGHVFDQKRLKQGLYRHPWDDILYL